jgi:capsular exopolysaccharide synthesis family protein
MSQIFDALQRSEAERAGSAASSPLEAAEVLQRAERFVASKWENKAVLGDAASLDEGDLQAELRRQKSDSPSLVATAMAPTESAKTDDRSRILGQFQPLPLTVSSQSRLVSLTEQDSPAAEAFRLLGVRLRDLGRTRTLKKILITSTIPKEGKTTIAANLACTLARATQQKILLLEGDVRRPALSQMLGLKGNPGICEWLRGDHKLSSCIYQLEGSGLWFMPAGSSPQNPLEVLQSVKLNALMSQLSEWFDTIVIDSPPVLPLADTSVWMRLADGIIFVVRQGTSEKKQLQRGLEALEPQKLIGALLNCSRNSTHNYYYY